MSEKVNIIKPGTTGEQKTLFYINKKTGEILYFEKIKNTGFYQQQQKDPEIENENIKAIKENAKVRRLVQRIYGTNNRRKIQGLPKYRKPAWSRRKKHG